MNGAAARERAWARALDLKVMGTGRFPKRTPFPLCLQFSP